MDGGGMNNESDLAARDAQQGERMIEIKVRFWTNDLADGEPRRMKDPIYALLRREVQKLEREFEAMPTKGFSSRSRSYR
jgi:hypothetical protein